MGLLVQCGRTRPGVSRTGCEMGSLYHLFATVSYSCSMPLQPRRTEFVSAQLTRSARDALRDAAVRLTSPVGRRVTMSDALSVALQMADERRDEWVRRLSDQ